MNNIKINVFAIRLFYFIYNKKIAYFSFFMSFLIYCVIFDIILMVFWGIKSSCYVDSGGYLL